MSRVVTIVAILGVLVTLSVGTLRPFTTTSRSSSTTQVLKCAAPIYDSGHDLKGADAAACNNEAKTRSETAGAIAAGIALIGVVLAYLWRPRN
jgi:hypothetical protein